MHSAAKQCVSVLVVAVLLVSSLVWANGPELSPQTRIPGMSAEQSLGAIVKAAAGAEDLLTKFGPKVGVSLPSQLGHKNRQCLLWFKLLGAVQGFPAAEDWATEGVKRWCAGGGKDNYGLAIMSLALKEHQSVSRGGLTEQEKQLLLEVAKWAAVGGAALLAVPSLAVP